MRYEVYTLDMWGHVGADCIGHGCPCVTQRDTEEDSLGESAAIAACEATATHDDNACQCSEDCNEQFRRGTITVPRDASDAQVIEALESAGFAFPKGTEVDDYSDGPLDLNDADGRRLLHQTPIEPMRFRVPLVWRRTAKYHERLRPHVHQDGRLDRFVDGGYPVGYLVTTPGNGYGRGEALDLVCPKCATDMHEGNWLDGAMVTHVDVNWENPDLYCDCGERIPSAYAECDDCDNGNMSTPGEYHEACEDPECPDTHLATCVTCKGHGGSLTDERKEEHEAWKADGEAWMTTRDPD